MRALLILFAAALLVPLSISSAEANVSRNVAKHSWRKARPQPVSDCVPFNGPFGYYGNPWCNPPSIRPPGTEFDQRR